MYGLRKWYRLVRKQIFNFFNDDELHNLNDYKYTKLSDGLTIITYL